MLLNACSERRLKCFKGAFIGTWAETHLCPFTWVRGAESKGKFIPDFCAVDIVTQIFLLLLGADKRG